MHHYILNTAVMKAAFRKPDLDLQYLYVVLSGAWLDLCDAMFWHWLSCTATFTFTGPFWAIPGYLCVVCLSIQFLNFHLILLPPTGDVILQGCHSVTLYVFLTSQFWSTILVPSLVWMTDWVSDTKQYSVNPLISLQNIKLPAGNQPPKWLGSLPRIGKPNRV